MKLGPYEILGAIGSGGAGTVFRARGPRGESVAVKVLRSSDSVTAARLAREVTVQRTLGAGFVPVLDAGVAPQGPYIVMPLIEGGTLRERLARGRMPFEEAVKLGVTLGAALGRAHEAGIVHRDLKPENVLFQGDRPLIADLGLAKIAGADDHLSKTGDARGTFGYMPPEQMRDAKRAGPEADVFALGAVVYECLTGRTAFQAASALELIDLVDSGRFAPVRRTQSGVPRAVAAVIERALAPDANDRFEDGAAFAEALSAAASGSSARSRGLLLVLGAALVVAGAAALAALLPRPEKTPPASPPSPPPAPAPGPTPAERGPAHGRLSVTAVLGATTLRHGGHATAIVARPGKNEVLVGDAQGFVRSWSVPAGAEVDTWELYRPGEVTALAALSDGTAVALGTGAGHGIVLLEPSPVRLTNIDSTEGTALAAAPEGTRFALLSPRKVRIFDRATRAELVNWGSTERRLTAIAFRTATTVLIGTQDGTVARMTIGGEAPVPTIARVPGPVRSIACTPDGSRVAILAGDGSVHYLADERQGAFEGLTAHALSFVPPSGHALGLWSEDDELLLGTIGPGGARAVKMGSGPPIEAKAGLAIVFHENQALYVAADQANGNPFVVGESRAPGHERLVVALLPLPGRRLASVGGDRTVRLWDLAEGREVAVHREHASLILGLSAAPGGRSVTTVSQDGQLVVRDPATLAPVSSTGLGFATLSVTHMPDGTGVASSSKGPREFSDAGAGATRLKGFKALTVESVGDERLLAWDEREARLYDTRTDSPLWTRKIGAPCGSWCSIARVGERLALGTKDGVLLFVDFETGESVWERRDLLAKGRVSAVTASPDGRWILVSGPPQHEIHVLDARTGATVSSAALPASFDFVSCLRFSEGELLVGTLRGEIVRMKLE